MLSHLSYRYKIPLALSAVILLTELLVTAALVSVAVSDARNDLESSAQNLGRVLTLSVRDALMKDDLWRAFEVIRTPVTVREPTNPLKEIVLFDAKARVYASTSPRKEPIQTAAAKLPAQFGTVIEHLRGSGEQFFFDFPGLLANRDVTAGMPVNSDDGSRLGYVVMVYDADILYGRVRSTLLKLTVATVPVLLVLIPLGWVWGDRMAKPLLRLSTAMARIGKEPPEDVGAGITADSNDEIGQLGKQFKAMLFELAQKQALEREVVVSERLAAVGRVAAGIAHEINNPLGGMLNAIDTLNTHGEPDAQTRKTLGLLQRGLGQIRATVGALLFEARLDSPAMNLSDWQDLKLLVAPQIQAKQATFHWDVELDEAIALPAHLVRQLVLNLLLNAVKAVEVGGQVNCLVAAQTAALQITVSNTGQHISGVAMEHLFEPFGSVAVAEGRRSYSLGLWVSYQIITQLGGTISVDSAPGRTCFAVFLPITSA
ncbi:MULTISPECIES: sensor histidine kinase [Paraburkholderia]|uniref:histidine kinase n=1 Tax=Paraburkholderia podalyriae TaxID=1938811 RepID=A0ABR7Q019_9BURK|nr:HAMP domain-containing sensor histidine kinase [Paraburkholderia podalyriae]MBC8751885.1 HAMP domain-containing histidine kinase [Paraburkholderia podalyriae]